MQRRGPRGAWSGAVGVLDLVRGEEPRHAGQVVVRADGHHGNPDVLGELRGSAAARSASPRGSSSPSPVGRCSRALSRAASPAAPMALDGHRRSAMQAGDLLDLRREHHLPRWSLMARAKGHHPRLLDAEPMDARARPRRRARRPRRAGGRSAPGPGRARSRRPRAPRRSRCGRTRRPCPWWRARRRTGATARPRAGAPARAAARGPRPGAGTARDVARRRGCAAGGRRRRSGLHGGHPGTRGGGRSFASGAIRSLVRWPRDDVRRRHRLGRRLGRDLTTRTEHDRMSQGKGTVRTGRGSGTGGALLPSEDSSSWGPTEGEAAGTVPGRPGRWRPSGGSLWERRRAAARLPGGRAPSPGGGCEARSASLAMEGWRGSPGGARSGRHGAATRGLAMGLRPAEGAAP